MPGMQLSTATLAAGYTSLASISRVLSRPLGKKGFRARRRDFDMPSFYQK